MSADSMIFVGIDVGSRTTKAIVLKDAKVIGRSIVSTGWMPDRSARDACDKAIRAANLTDHQSTILQFKEHLKIVATGYGRVTVPFADKTITEITAHARGVAEILPEARTLIDIGGQDSKATILEDGGLVADFAMNDRCAAGSGKFLEFLAHTMELSVEEFANLAFSSQNPVSISSICTVFAESEILSLLAEGAVREDVAVSVHRSIAQRVALLARSLHPREPVAFSGGVAKNRCMVRELSSALSLEIIVPEAPEYIGALGAAVIASGEL